MKYYRLITENQKDWPSFEPNKIYPENFKNPRCGMIDVDYHANRHKECWQEVTESEYLIQEAKERYRWSEIIKESKEMELKITKERVLSAADKCPQAKATLKELFPDVFEESYLKKISDTHNSIHLVRYIGKMDYECFKKIPGNISDQKAESIAKLIYETWIK